MLKKILLVSVLFCFIYDSSKAQSKYEEEAIQKIFDGDIEGSIEDLRQSLEENPNSVLSQFALANQLFEKVESHEKKDRVNIRFRNMDGYFRDFKEAYEWSLVASENYQKLTEEEKKRIIQTVSEAGDEVTFIPDVMTTAGKDGRQQDVADSVWWSTFIRNELRTYAPIPPNSESAERERILKSATRRLFATTPLPSEKQAFLNDDSNEALENLVKILAARPGTKVIEDGALQSGSTTFRVLPVDPEAKLKPRLALGPGRYQISETTLLRIVGRGAVMDAKLEIASEAEAYDIRLPPKRGVWAIAWKRDVDFMWIADRGKLRKLDFSNPKDIEEKVFYSAEKADIPERYLQALQATLDAGHQPPATAR